MPSSKMFPANVSVATLLVRLAKESRKAGYAYTTHGRLTLIRMAQLQRYGCPPVASRERAFPASSSSRLHDSVASGRECGHPRRHPMDKQSINDPPMTNASVSDLRVSLTAAQQLVSRTRSSHQRPPQGCANFGIGTLGSGLIKSTKRERQQGRPRRGSCAPVGHSEWRCA